VLAAMLTLAKRLASAMAFFDQLPVLR